MADRRFFLPALLGCLLTASPLSAGETASGDKTATARFAAVSAVVEQELTARHVPGAVILVGRQKEILYRRPFGERMVAPEPAAMTADTVFDVASLTKVIVTTTAIMQLVERGQLDLNDRVAKYWPEFAAAGKAEITVQQLLTHCSGLPPDLDLDAAWTGKDAALARTADSHPLHPPGEAFRYSDINFIALGALVERISGEPLDVYAAEHIFRPLGMRDSGFRPDPALKSRIAPADIEAGALRWGEVQDPTAFRMGGVAGHAGLFSTVEDLAKFAQMLLGQGARDGVRILQPESVRRMTTPVDLPGGIRRGLGWDSSSPFEGGMGSAFGPASYGHTGYTGTSIWIDPASQSFLIILTNRLNPDGRGSVKELRRRVAALVAEAERAEAERTAPSPVRAGIDVLAAEDFAPLAHRRVGIIANEAARNAAGQRTIDAIARAPGVTPVAIFTPEHGLHADREGTILSDRDAATGLPIYSLYGATRRPLGETLVGIDALVIDLPDVGVRFYTYSTTMAYVLEEAARRGIEVFVLDRPDPISAAVVEGPVLDPALRSFTGYFPMPVRHGMTIGELAAMFNGENRIGSRLTIVSMQGYQRGAWYDETGLGWVNPSPNLRSLTAAILYPGVALIEGANVSVGRGTAHPFELVGAPWIDPALLLRHLRARSIPGVSFETAEFTPSDDRYAGKPCRGIRIILTDRRALDTPLLGVELAAALHRLYPARFELERTVGLFGSRAVVQAIAAGEDPRGIEAGWQDPLRRFQDIRAKYLLY